MTIVEIPKGTPEEHIWHVTPLDDLREHVHEAGECWCQPRIEDEGFRYVVVHNSADGREDFETGRRKPS